MKIQLNAAARAAIRHHSDPARPFRETARQVGPDAWEVEVDYVTFQTLKKWRARLLVSNYSDVILWLAANQKGKPGAHCSPHSSSATDSRNWKHEIPSHHAADHAIEAAADSRRHSARDL